MTTGCGCHRVDQCRLTPDDRRHGTVNGYSNYGCGCEPCRAIHAKAIREAKARRAEQITPSHVHGTANGYGNYRCRCAPCREAWREAERERKKRRRRGETDVAQGIFPPPRRRGNT